MTRRLLVAIAGGALVVLGWTATRADHSHWPDGPVRAVEVPLTEGEPIRVFLDAGHGAPDNPGNTSAYCEAEERFTLSLAEDVAEALAALEGFEVALSRRSDELVDYRARVREAEAWGADAFVSLHSDVRGEGDPWSPEVGLSCPKSHAAPGFSLLVSDQRGDAEVGLSLARATAESMRQAGFSPYDGRHYGPIYAADVPGVFLDRHDDHERIFVLWRPSMPSILVETHHALDDREVRRWREPATRDAFTRALASALVATLRE